MTVLVDRTEGWAAGLQLAGMTLRTYPDSGDFVAQFGGTDRLISDYLSQEVLDAQPDDRRQFLLRISVLDEMCADLISHLTGEPHAQQILEELERESMFLVPLDSRRQWYRFHHLFRDLLRFRLRAEYPGSEPVLLRQAAQWHLDHGAAAAAIECLLFAREWDSALELILGRGSEVYERGEMATVIRWISAVPDEVRADPPRRVAAPRAPEGNGGPSRCRRERVPAGDRPSHGHAGQVACAQVFKASLAQWRSNASLSIDAAAEALELLDGLGDEALPVVMSLSDEQSLRSMAWASGGRAHFLVGHFEEARRWLETGLASGGAAYSVWRVHGLGSLALLEAWCGNCGPAEAYAEEALDIARSVGMLNHPSTADAFLALTLVALERGEPRRAAISLHEGSLRAEANHRSNLSWVAELELALLQTAEGEAEAGRPFAPNRDRLGAPPPHIVDERLRALQARSLRLNGNYREAARVSARAHPGSEILRFEQVATALAMARPDQARKIVDAAPEDTYSGHPAAAVRALLLQAWLSQVEDSADESRRLLVQALEVGERALVGGVVRASRDRPWCSWWQGWTGSPRPSGRPSSGAPGSRGPGRRATSSSIH